MSTFKYRRCVKCGASLSTNSTVRMHRFPLLAENKGNLDQLRAWAVYSFPDKDWSNIDELRKLHKSGKLLCGKHFDDSAYCGSDRKWLIKFAAPFYEDKENQHVAGPSGNTRELSALKEHNYSLTAQNRILPQEVSEPTTQTSTKATMENASSSTQCHPVSSLDVPLITERTNDDQIAREICTDNTTTSINMNSKEQNKLSPKDVKLYHVCRNKMREILRLRRKIKDIKTNPHINIISENETIRKFCDMNLSNTFITLLQSQIKNCPKKPKGRRYTLEQKLMALVIYKKSSACYRLLRRMFALPSQSSLDKLLNRVPLKPGINKHIFSALENMSKKQSDKDNMCILSFDEMSIRKHLYYNRKLDLIQGYHDHGNHGRSNEVASKALVFMLSGIRKKWKQPIAYYLSSTINSDRMIVIVKEILNECFKAKMDVLATVCDLCTVNIKVLKTLGATTREPYFSFGEKEIVTILDPPHLLKCTRNLFMKHNVACITEIQCGGAVVKGTAKWDDIVKFYNIDKNNVNFVFAPLLTERHLKPNLKEQMRVKLAAQVFSHSVTAGILSKVASNELPASALATATFLQKFDELFDAVNAETQDLRRGKKYSTNMTKKSPHLSFFNDMRNFISRMTYLGSKNTPPSQNGWIHTMNAIERLWKKLQIKKINSLSTRRLNQDPLENFFGCVRFSCGSNNNPTVPQFVAGFKTAIITNLRHSGQKKNCEDDAGTLADNLTSFITAENIEEKSVEILYNEIDLDKVLSDATEKVNQATPEAQACGYVSGFIFKRLRHSNCPECRKVFLTQSHETIHIFTTYREYSDQDCLNYIDPRIIQCVEAMATMTNEFFSKNSNKNDIMKNIFQIYNKIDFGFLSTCQTHFDDNQSHLKRSVFFICIKRYIILENRKLEENERKKALEKKIKILKNK